MKREQIINQVANNPKLKTVAKNIGGSFGDDLFQELFIRLARIDEEKIITAYKENWIDYLCVNIMSKVKHEILRGEPETIELTEIILCTNPYEEMEAERKINEYEDLLQPIDNYLEQPITQENFYGVTILKTWIAGESYRTIAKRTRIPIRSICDTVQKEVKKLREQCL